MDEHSKGKTKRTKKKGSQQAGLCCQIKGRTKASWKSVAAMTRSQWMIRGAQETQMLRLGIISSLVKSTVIAQGIRFQTVFFFAVFDEWFQSDINHRETLCLSSSSTPRQLHSVDTGQQHSFLSEVEIQSRIIGGWSNLSYRKNLKRLESRSSWQLGRKIFMTASFTNGNICLQQAQRALACVAIHYGSLICSLNGWKLTA